MTVTGTVSPASVKTRVIPALRPTRPGALAALIVIPRFLTIPPALRSGASHVTAIFPMCPQRAITPAASIGLRRSNFQMLGVSANDGFSRGTTGATFSDQTDHAARAVPRQGQTSAQKRREL